jgi:hypothetical protein
MTLHVVVQRPTIAQRHPNHIVLGMVRRLAHRFRNLSCLTGSVTDAPAAVSDDDQGSEREPPPTLDHLGHPVDMNETVGKFRLFGRLLLRLTIALP